MNAADAEVIFTMVTDSTDVEQVVPGEQGVIHAARAASVLVDMETISPAAARAIAQVLVAMLVAGCAAMQQPVAGIADALPGAAFKDCDGCPLMVVVPPGEFVMGSPPSAGPRGRSEGPQLPATISRPVAVARFEVTRDEYAAFMRDSGYSPAPGNCFYLDQETGGWTNDDATKSWRDPGHEQSGDHPVVCASWDDAKAYVGWLSRKTDRNYRLLSEVEWEYVARAGSSSSRPWGDDPDEACRHANVGDLARDRVVWLGAGQKWATTHNCDDGFGFTAPVGRFKANRFGLHDLLGNAGEWVEDCWNDTHAGLTADGSARLSGDCRLRVARGGAWSTGPAGVRSALRSGHPPEIRMNSLGFRVARDQ